MINNNAMILEEDRNLGEGQREIVDPDANPERLSS